MTQSFEDVPRLPIDDVMEDLNKDEDNDDPDERRPIRLLDSRIQNDGELSDSEDEGEGGRRDRSSHRDPDSASSGGRRFGVGVGIMGAAPLAGATATAIAGSGGPSAHTTIDSIVQPEEDADTAKEDMDVDKPTARSESPFQVEADEAPYRSDTGIEDDKSVVQALSQLGVVPDENPAEKSNGIHVDSRPVISDSAIDPALQ